MHRHTDILAIDILALFLQKLCIEPVLPISFTCPGHWRCVRQSLAGSGGRGLQVRIVSIVQDKC